MVGRNGGSWLWFVIVIHDQDLNDGGIQNEIPDDYSWRWLDRNTNDEGDAHSHEKTHMCLENAMCLSETIISSGLVFTSASYSPYSTLIVASDSIMFFVSFVLLDPLRYSVYTAKGVGFDVPG